jgi:RTX calcium-binding nonapeptide repeat (4 copies)
MRQLPPLLIILELTNPTEGDRMGRLMMLLGIVMLIAVMTTGVAVAVTKTCGDNLPCEGTDNEDVLHERHGTVKDVIYGFKAEDVLDANNFFKDRDRLFGGDNGDKLLANDNDGRDVLRGGQGRDRCYGDPGDRFVNCQVENTALAAGLSVE